jgi:hypothetical protein
MERRIEPIVVSSALSSALPGMCSHYDCGPRASQLTRACSSDIVAAECADAVFFSARFMPLRAQSPIQLFSQRNYLRSDSVCLPVCYSAVLIPCTLAIKGFPLPTPHPFTHSSDPWGSLQGASCSSLRACSLRRHALLAFRTSSYTSVVRLAR